MSETTDNYNDAEISAKKPAESFSLGDSPMLSAPIKERDYTSGLGGMQQQQSPQPQVQQEQQQTVSNDHSGGEQTASGVDQSATVDSGQGFNYSQVNDGGDIPPMSFMDEEEEAEDDDLDGGDGSTFDFSPEQSKVFSEILIESGGNLCGTVAHNYTKIDVENARMAVLNNVLHPAFVSTFEQINHNNEDIFFPTDEEKKQMKKGLTAWLNESQAKFANAQNAFLVAVGAYILRAGIQAQQIRKENKELIKNAIRQSNPNFHQDAQQMARDQAKTQHAVEPNPEKMPKKKRQKHMHQQRERAVEQREQQSNPNRPKVDLGVNQI